MALSPIAFPSLEAEDILYQMYTSGTTGRPKGAMLTHGAVTSNMWQTITALQVVRGDRTLVIMPMYHAGAAMSCFTWMSAGATLVIRSQFDAHEAVRLLDEDNIAVASFVPAMLQSMLVDVEDVSARQYPTLRAIAYGASPNCGRHTLSGDSGIQMRIRPVLRDD